MLRRLLLLSGFAALTVLAVGLSGAGARHSPAFVCDGNFNNLAVSGDLIVPTNAFCNIGDGSTVSGNVQVESQGGFGAGKSEVRGNVSAAGGPGVVFLEGTVVDGNVTVEREDLQIFGGHVGLNVMADGSAFVILDGSSGAVTVGGNIMVRNAQGGNPANFLVSLNGLTVGGNVLLFDNQARTAIGATQIGRNLICSGNADLIGGDVTARRKIGQCANL
jgi:hypothetical protein